MNIDKIKVCKPIETLVELFLENQFEVIESKIEDYHFHEVYIKIQGTNSNNVDLINVEKIQKINDEKFYCTCHWSIVEISQK